MVGWSVACSLAAHRPFGGWLWFFEEDATTSYTIHFSYFAFRSSVHLTKLASSLYVCVCAHCMVHILLLYELNAHTMNIFQANVYECEYVFCLFTPYSYCISFAFWSDVYSGFFIMLHTHERTSSMHDNMEYSGMKG